MAPVQFGLEKDLWLNKNTHQTFALRGKHRSLLPCTTSTSFILSHKAATGKDISHKYLIVVFLETMFDQDKVSSQLYVRTHFHIGPQLWKWWMLILTAPRCSLPNNSTKAVRISFLWLKETLAPDTLIYLESLQHHDYDKDVIYWSIKCCRSEVDVAVEKLRRCPWCSFGESSRRKITSLTFIPLRVNVCHFLLFYFLQSLPLSHAVKIPAFTTLTSPYLPKGLFACAPLANQSAHVVYDHHHQHPVLSPMFMQAYAL